jgi:hypothetical protein
MAATKQEQASQHQQKQQQQKTKINMHICFNCY